MHAGATMYQRRGRWPVIAEQRINVEAGLIELAQRQFALVTNVHCSRTRAERYLRGVRIERGIPPELYTRR